MNGRMTNINFRAAQFISVLEEAANMFEETSKSKGFMQQGTLNGTPEVHIGLLHGEVSELNECMRLPQMPQSKKIPDFTEEEEELADIFIRTFIQGKLRGISGGRLAEAVLAKAAYNDTRPKMHGGKRY